MLRRDPRQVVVAALLTAGLAAPAAAPASSVATAALAAPPESQRGVEAPARRGFYAETAVGLFGTVGGSRGVSFAQPALGMAVGRDLGEAAAVFVQLTIGASRASCFDGPLVGCRGADSFGASFLELGLQLGAHLLPRLRLSGKLIGGYTALSPSPLASAAGGPVASAIGGPHVGAGLGFDYDTHLDHFAVGFDLLGRHTRASRPGAPTLGLTSFAMMPRIKYVF
ncbi:MAG: hypothetical protein NVS4B10_11040 [Myxococcales bacterium]